jgi:lipid A ethanolaminephosphotransferase
MKNRLLTQIFDLKDVKKSIATVLLLLTLSILPNILMLGKISNWVEFLHLLLLIIGSSFTYYVAISLYSLSRILSISLLSIIFAINSFAVYAIAKYNVSINYNLYFDIFGNNLDEIIRYSGAIISVGVIKYFVLLFIFPLALTIFCIKKNYVSFKFSFIALARILLILICVGIYALSIRSSKHYMPNKNNIKEITSAFAPNNYIYGGFQYYKKQRRVMRQNLKTILPDAVISQNKNNINVILIVGESARSDHFSINSYERKTNPKLETLLPSGNLTSFKNFTSCGTSTWHSVPCMFSRMTSDEFSLPVKEENIISVLDRLKINTYWFSTQSSCITTCDKMVNKEVGLSGDEILLERLQNTLLNNKQSSKLIVLHHNGSHYPYHPFFKKNHEKFAPFCQKNDFTNLCDKSSIINAYDNTIVSTDEFIFNVINLAKKYPNSIVIYTSDHGQSLGENGIYAHNQPKIYAPFEQIHVPLIIWTSDSLKKEYKITSKCLDAKRGHSHDSIFHSILNLFNVKAADYNSDLDIFSKCREVGH